MNNKKVLFCIIATGEKYFEYSLNLIQSIQKYMLLDHKVNILLFTDQPDPKIKNVKIKYTKQTGWPGPTLLRYHILLSSLKEYMKYDYIYYIDSDMEVVDIINAEDLFGDLVAVNHVGWYKGNLSEAPFERSIFSKAYIKEGTEEYYYHATFFGASKYQFLKMVLTIRDYIQSDMMNGFLTTSFWDELFLNKYLLENKPTKILDPGFAFFYHWRNDAPFKPRIINIDKNNTNDIKKIRGTFNTFLFDYIKSYLNIKKYNLLDTTFVFFYKKDSLLREEHLYTTINYLNTCFNTKFLIFQINDDSNIELNNKNLTVIKVKNNFQFNYINHISDIKKYIDTKYICLSDVDSIIQPHNYILSKYCLNYYKFIFPHNGVKLNISNNDFNIFKESFDITSFDLSDQIYKNQYSVKWIRKGFIPLFFNTSDLDKFNVNFDTNLSIKDQNNIIYEIVKKHSYYFTPDFIGHFNHTQVKFEKYEYENKDNGLIAILVSAYNSNKYLPTTLDYLLNQTYSNYIVLLVDDGSTDNSILTYKKYHKLYKNKFLYFIKEKNEGTYSARNYALDKLVELKIDPKYIMFHDSDDLSSPDKLSILSNYLNQNTNFDFVGSFTDFIDEYDQNIPVQELSKHYNEFRYETDYIKIKEDLPVKNNFMFCGVLFKYDSVKNFKFIPGYFHEDYEYISRLIRNGKICCNLTHVLNKYRIHTESKTKHKNIISKKRLHSIHEKNLLFNLKNKSKSLNIGVIVIATNKYRQLAKPLLKSIQSKFLIDHNVKIFLFTDDPNDFDDSLSVNKIKINHEIWPYITLKRYNLFNNNITLFNNIDYIYYIDADMEIIDFIGDEIIDNLVCASHPYFYNMGKKFYTYERNPISEAYIPDGEGTEYYHGTFLGGNKTEFFKMSFIIDSMVQSDLNNNGYIPVWWDESFLNKYLYLNPPTKLLSPSYAVPNNYNYDPNLQYLHRFVHKINVIKKNNNQMRERKEGEDWGFIHNKNEIKKVNSKNNKLIVHKEEYNGKVDLLDCTFIIPINIDSIDRMVNLYLSLEYLKKYFNTNIYLGEMSNKYKLDNIESKFNNIKYFKIKPNKYEFQRTIALNYLTKKVKTKVICIYDADVFMFKEQYIDSCNLILNEQYDMVIPHNGCFMDIDRSYINKFKHKLDLYSIYEYTNKRFDDNYYKGVGGALFFNTKSYKQAGMENTKFVNWGAEDEERYERMNKLGYKITFLSNPIFHLNHSRKFNEKPNNNTKEYLNNLKERDKIINMTKEELIGYIKTWKK